MFDFNFQGRTKIYTNKSPRIFSHGKNKINSSNRTIFD